MADPYERTRLTDAATVAGFRLGSLAARVMPSSIAAAAASSLGFGASIASVDRRLMVQRHLKRVNPRLTGTALRLATQTAFDSYARYYMDSFRLPALSKRTVERGFSLEGFHYVEKAVAKGVGTILALPHLGGWEWAGRWLTDRGYKMSVVVAPLDPPELFEWFMDMRKDLGMNVIALGPRAGGEVLRALRDNEVVCLLSDRDIDRSGVEVEFFGERTTLPGGPATLALRTGAPIVPTAIYFDGPDNRHAVLLPPLDTTRQGKLRDDVQRVTQDLAAALEVLIRRAPEQWHLLQPNWPSDRTS